jgi:hypothetical protein
LLSIFDALGVRMRERGVASRDTACTIYTVPHTIINVHLIILTFWLHGVVGADLRPNTQWVNALSSGIRYIRILI